MHGWVGSPSTRQNFTTYLPATRSMSGSGPVRKCHRSESASGLVILQRGCELALFQRAKVGNVDCTFCLDCVHACPHDNSGMLSRAPASELMVDPQRSGIGLKNSA